MHGIQEVLSFWFGAEAKRHWFEPGPAFDQEVRRRFAELFARAATGDLRSWETTAEGCLALCILLDQMPRNMFRGDARAFATDDKALKVAEHAVKEGFDQELSSEQKPFLYLPFMHSESLANQLRCLALFEAQGLHEGRKHAEEHVAIIRRFGRFPHRNAALRRTTTEAESQFLEDEGETHGQEPPLGSMTDRRPDSKTGSGIDKP
jgi:uncharacterized protein (DUF924 family)